MRRGGGHEFPRGAADVEEASGGVSFLERGNGVPKATIERRLLALAERARGNDLVFPQPVRIVRLKLKPVRLWLNTGQPAGAAPPNIENPTRASAVVASREDTFQQPMPTGITLGALSL